ncbi:hypothetical protein ACROYT_G044609 [Oculina patagonica]
MAPVSKTTKAGKALSEENPAEIKEFVETTITIEKETAGLGLGIVGGSDTYLGGVVINVIEIGSAAAKDGRVAIGDQIIKVNGESLQQMSHKNAVSALRLAPSPVKLTILREKPEKIFTSTEEPSTVFEVTLIKSITDYLGLCILARKDKKGVFVTYVSEDSIAYNDGLIKQGDKILEVNGVSLKKTTQDEACKVLRRAFGTVKLKIGRVPSLHDSLCSDKTKQSYVNHGLEDDGGTSKEFRRWNSFGFEQKKKRKIPRDPNNQVPARRRSLSCHDYGQASDIDPEGRDRASSEHDVRRNSQPRHDRRNEEPRERFRYVYPDRIELSIMDKPKRQSYQREAGERASLQI